MQAKRKNCEHSPRGQEMTRKTEKSNPNKKSPENLQTTQTLNNICQVMECDTLKEQCLATSTHNNYIGTSRRWEASLIRLDNAKFPNLPGWIFMSDEF